MNKKKSALYGIFIILVAIAFFLRLYNLDERVFHHDEAAMGYFTYQLFKDGVYSYNPSFHGPFIYYVTAGMFKIFGDSIFIARLLPALLGASMILFLIPLRQYIGDRGMVISAFFLAFSPSFVYYSRFFRTDIFISFFYMAILVCAVKYIENKTGKFSVPGIMYLFFGAAGLASLTALKENGYITVTLIAFFLFLVFARGRWYKGLFGKLKRQDKVVMITLAEGLFSILVLLVVFSLFYTGKPFDPAGMMDAVGSAVSHWVRMHEIERIGGPMYYYLPIMALYELPVVVFGFAGIIHFYRKNNFLMNFLAYWALMNLLVYSYLQEKVPWLVLNPLLPLVIIAGTYIGELVPQLRNGFRQKAGALIIIFLILGSSYFVYSGVLLNYRNFTNPAEPLIQAAQPPQDFSGFIGKIEGISSQYDGKSTRIQVTDGGIETQFLWYLRHFDNVKWKVSLDAVFDAPLVVAHDTDGNRSEADIVRSRLRTDYERLDSAKMSWYFLKPADVTLDFLLYRKIDREPGGYRIVLFYQPRV
ncbi:MAG: TIGR03663 family protein [Candidatus Methanoperedenaceae archaeon]|nr:TIGR03663 family protein [Candidatus Methanoperedenaceae archaeon]